MTRLYKLLELAIIISMLTSLFVGNVISAEDSVENIVSTRFDIEFVSASDLKISVTIDVNQITVFDNAYTSSEIQSLNDSEITGAIKLTIRNSLKEQLKNSFEHANVAALNEKPTREGAIFYDDFSVDLTSLFFGMNESVNTYNFVNGILYMGAITNYTFTLHANSGWTNTYAFSLSTPMMRHYTNGEETANVIQWQVDNSNGMHPTSLAELQIKLDNYNQLRLESEDIQLEFELDTRNVDQTSLTTNIIARNVDIREYDILPSFVNKLDFVPSDGIRLLVDNGLLTWEQFYEKTLEKVKDRIVPLIENSPKFNQTLDLDLMENSEIDGQQVVSFDISHMDNETPIDATFLDEDVNLRICDVSPRALFGLVNVGADVNITSEDINFGEGIDVIEYEYNTTIYLPEKITLDEQNIYTWGKNERLSGKLLSEFSTKYSKNDISTVVEIEVDSIDLNLLSFFTGRTELNFGLNVEEQRSYKVSEIPDEFVLPKKVVITYLPSDAFRLCIDDGVFDEDSVGLFLNNEKRLFEVRMESILQNSEINGHINEGVFSQSLEWNEKIASMTETDPIKVASYAHSSSSVAFDLSYIPPSLEINDQHFNFSSLKDQDVTYRIIFPHGTNVELPDVIGKAEIKEADDGRQYIEVSFNSSEFGLYDMVVCKVVPSSPLFIIGIFAPCILSFVVTVILVALVFFLRKKRKGRGKLTKSNEVYEEQEYYVPPRPPTRR